ncbi:MAG: peptidoglycan DD-metalloendopeptidase family protein [Bacteroidota bacterium]
MEQHHLTALFFKANQGQPLQVLDKAILVSQYCPLDLSMENTELSTVAISDPDNCQNYIDTVLARNSAVVAYGGYLEKRRLYALSERFAEGGSRDIHLGMDFWCAAGTAVLCPLQGKVHSFANNADHGNYGPTIILKHQLGELQFYSLYGHLSLESLDHIYPGKVFGQGDVLATIGTTAINVGYAPHLHFQLVLDLGSHSGDYPGVCAEKELEFYKNNCPNPYFLLKFP